MVKKSSLFFNGFGTNIAVGHAILVIAYHILKKRIPYYELGADYFDRLNIKTIMNHFVKLLNGLL